EQAAKLFDREKGTGILIDKKFRRDEAESVLDLLDGIPQEQRQQPETYEALIAYLRHNRLEVRELALRHLLYLVPDGRNIPYNRAGDSAQLREGYEAWKKKIPSGKLPPQPPPTKPMPGMP